MGGVLPAGAAMTAGFSAAALLGEEITGQPALGTLAAAALTVGAAVSTVPLSRYMVRRGRRPGLRLAWSLGFGGATFAFLAAVLDFYPFLLLGLVGIGIGQAASLAARYAATDLAPEGGRAKAIGILVWVGAWGFALGPTLGLGVAGSVANAVGLPELAGAYLMGMVLFSAAAFWIDRRLRPDPLEVAGGIQPVDPDAPEGPGGLKAIRRQLVTAAKPLGEIFRLPSARLAVLGMLVSQAVMVAIMTATPLHMNDGAQEIQIIGFVITFHIVGMFFFTPVVGWLVDRIGPSSLIAVGGLILAIGAETAAHTSAEDRLGVFVGLFLVGLGWSFCFISGSSLLTASFPIEMRVTTQGSADLVMNGAGAIAALLAGVVCQFDTYYGLSHYSGLAAIALAAFALWHINQMSRKPPAVAS